MPDALECREVREDGTENYSDPEWVVLSGGDPENPNWHEFVEGHERVLRLRLEAARRWLMARADGIPLAEDWCDGHYLEFSDGRKIAFTWRGWGNFAQAAVDKREGYRTYYKKAL